MRAQEESAVTARFSIASLRRSTLFLKDERNFKRGKGRRQESSVSQRSNYWVKFNKNKNYISFLFIPSYVPDTVLDLPDEVYHCAHVIGKECKMWVKDQSQQASG